jgi:hypothetical protein
LKECKKLLFGHKEHLLHWESGVLANRLTYFRAGVRSVSRSRDYHGHGVYMGIIQDTSPTFVFAIPFYSLLLESQAQQTKKSENSNASNHGISSTTPKERPKAGASLHMNSNALTRYDCPLHIGRAAIFEICLFLLEQVIEVGLNLGAAGFCFRCDHPNGDQYLLGCTL